MNIHRQVECDDPDCNKERIDGRYSTTLLSSYILCSSSSPDQYIQRNVLRDWRGAPIKSWDIKLPPSKQEAARKIQRVVYLRHYTRRRVAARKITRGCHAWVWKPMCKDGTIGIRPRLDMKELGVI
jgi:hypothetical protein